MSFVMIVTVLLALSAMGYHLGRTRALATVEGRIARLHSVPGYYGGYVALWCGLPALLLLVFWIALQPVVIDRMVLASFTDERIAGLSGPQRELLMATVRNIARGVGFTSDDPAVTEAAARLRNLWAIADWAKAAVALSAAMAGLYWARTRIVPKLRARNRVEKTIRILMVICSVIAILTTIGIVVSLFFESVRFFARYSVIDFLFGLKWSPQTAIREDQVGSSGAFGAIPVFAGTLLISVIALLVAVPIGLLSAIYLADYASRRVRATVKPIIEVLAGVPTVVYGFFAVLTIAPAMRRIGAQIGLTVDANSALAAGLVMGIMIIPFVSSLSDDVISAVPQSLREGSYGARRHLKSETVRNVIVPGGPARDRRRRAAGCLTRYRRDHDRGHGSWLGREPDRQPIRGGHHGDRSDRHAAGRRPGVRQRQDAGRVRARAGAVLVIHARASTSSRCVVVQKYRRNSD